MSEQTLDLLWQAYEQAGNSAPAERRHALTPSLRDSIRDCLKEAESDRSPVTEEWLRAVGFKTCAHWGAMNIGDWQNSMALEWDHGKWKLTLCRFAFGSNVDFNHEIPAPPTRGHVRRLCAALGIALKESR